MKEDLPSRRQLLRGTLALGSGLCVPALFSGCDSKNTANPSSTATPAPAPAPTAPVTDGTPAATNKLKKENAQYQEQPKGDQKCSSCMHFIATSNTCTVVEGQISPDGWCMLWVKKA